MSRAEIIYIAAEHIRPHPDNPRKNLGDLSELVASIKVHGVLQNLTVVPMEGEPGEYMTLIRHRRYAAGTQAKVKEFPCQIKEGLTKREQVSIMLEENMQRNDLTIIEQAQGFQMMLDLGETEESIAEKTGFSKTTIKHRLNIAKLDQEELKKKEEDGCFQMTLKDLYELERIEDVEIRNKILKEAKDSRELVWKAQNAVKEAEKAKKVKQIEVMLKKLGVEKAPKEAENEQYTGKWNTVKEIELDKDMPKRITLKETDTMYYLVCYRSVKIIKKAKKVKKELTPQEIRQKKVDKDKKTVKSRVRDMDESRREFIRNIISGKIAAVKNEDKIREKIWRFLMEAGGYLYQSNMRRFYTGKNDYDCTAEEKDEAQKKVEGLSFTHSMLISMHVTMENIGDIYDWQGRFKPDIGSKLVHAYEVLKPYGWTFVNEDDEQILNGTHELYVKEEEEKKS